MQVMVNLLQNAVRFGYREQPIAIVANRAEPHIIIRIRNYGPGVLANQEELIFQPFYIGSAGGPGLGLFVSRRLVEAMGGQLRLSRHSDPTEFSIYLPTMQEQAL
jgi:signal transduction histidine kinase